MDDQVLDNNQTYVKVNGIVGDVGDKSHAFITRFNQLVNELGLEFAGHFTLVEFDERGIVKDQTVITI